MVNTKRLAEQIKKLRIENELTQEMLAIEMHTTRQTISKWEQWTIEPNIQMLNKLASFFNVSLDELVNGHEVETKSDNGTSNVVGKPINGWPFLTQKWWFVLLIVIIVCGTLSQIFG